MKTKTTQRMHQPVKAGKQVKLFNLTGANPPEKALLEKAKKHAPTEQPSKVAPPVPEKIARDLDVFSMLTQPLDMFGINPLSGGDDNPAYWGDYYQRQAANGTFNEDRAALRDKALADYISYGGQDPENTNVLQRGLNYMFNPGDVRRNAAQGYDRALAGTAKQLEASGLDPEQAMVLARRTLGSANDWRQGVADKIYQSGSSWQQMFTPGEDLLDARARSIVNGGQGGGSIFSGVVGGLGDYFSGNQRLQDVAGRSARMQLDAANKQLERDANRQAQRTNSGQIADWDQYKRNWAARQHGTLGSQESQALQLQDATADWRRGRGIGRWIPGVGGSQSRLQSDRDYAESGSWGDLSAPWRWAQRAGAALSGDAYSAHDSMMANNEAYRNLANRVQSGNYQFNPMDDLSGLVAAQKGDEYGWYNPIGWFDSDGRAGNSAGVDFTKALSGNQGFESVMANLDRYSAADQERIRHNLSSLSADQRKDLGLDRAFELSADPRRQAATRARMNLDDMSTAEDRAEAVRRFRGEEVKPAAPASSAGQTLPSDSSNPPAGSTLPSDREKTGFDLSQQWGSQTSRAGSGFPTSGQHAPVPQVTEPGSSMRRLQDTQRSYRNFDPRQAAQAWSQGTNPYGADKARTSFSTWISRPFMSEEDIRYHDPATAGVRSALQRGEWRPGMSAEQAATGTGWRAIGGLTDWLGMTSSPAEQAAEMQRQQLSSQGMKDLEEQYASGMLSAEQFRNLSGASSVAQLYRSDPKRFQQLAGRAAKARAGLTMDSLRSQAQEVRRHSLGDNWDVSMVS